ncbi:MULTISPECIES: type II toxin-antitoxin system VapC family toxin [Rhizobium]|uniref:type II toxin-antitoxin system VapC family toxin n=1 Tax=Rhizobium TaxID=379 RepID=UPI001B339E9D|nr:MULTISPECIES: type II toxin-antitoxin system VapC family toxin [Rhizobium]MBX4908710.1 type II toxin-antitoxin system VapC family toxin [Rhizobium bangladeshense]MBX5215700.1 type II toxin-antitoxin system VapC family toxin [Rhizobium sp. NLR9a]MBX5233927.1 type II toxin-antitoxin system VapC family toxin [Rhizobium sp. NLR4a]MBX5246398.1 type II toxin-antitoxin system VapC family toxin [Rhizobium sp. NLR3b]MBX5250945.1 type II toxin-antitoxin system VapC family toxin [Rhizobium sp. NLR4b]
MIVDTNVLVRAAVDDDPKQTERARMLMREAEQLFVSNLTFCEFVWVVGRIYRKSAAEIAATIRLLIADRKVVYDRAAVEAGLSFLDAGGDFADGVIVFEGRRLGGEVFATFNRKAAAIVESAGRACLLLSSE